MAAPFTRSQRKSPQAGVSMIELLIAGVVLVVGCLALMGLILTGISTNNRNKLDTTSTLLAQSVFEQLDNVPANSPVSSGMRRLTDCAGNAWDIAAAPGGAPLSGGSIDFAAATVANYNMQWVVCIGATRTTYDVRWNVQQLTSGTSLVTVGAKKAGAGNGLAYFALPVNMRRIFGQ